jgi:UDP-2,3-diacylglucosamine hydrolase
MDAIFLSDAHIRTHDDPNLPPLLAFLESIRGIERLFIVGDLFDTWFALRRAVFEEYVPLLGALDALRRSGSALTYVTGNHDFEMGRYFTEVLGADVRDTEMTLEADGRRAFIAHGDMVNPADKKYRRLRRILRSWPVRALGRNLPAAWVWAVAQHMTEHYTGEEIARRMPLAEIFRSYAAAKQADGFDTVILGHLHIPALEESPDPPRTYVNLGDWITHRTFLRWREGRLELRQWAWPGGEEREFRMQSAE